MIDKFILVTCNCINFIIETQMTILCVTWCYRVSTRSDYTSVSIYSYWLIYMLNLFSNFCQLKKMDTTCTIVYEYD